MRSFFGGQQKQTPQTILKELLHNVSQSQTTKISPQQIGYFMKYTQNIDLAGELVLALTDHIDQHASDPADVLKTLQILFFCLSKAHDTVLPAAQAFAPEIATIFLLSFEKSNCTLRDAVHLLTRTIYNHLIRNEPLPSLESYGLNFDVQSPPPAESRQQRPSNRAPPLGRSNKQGQQPFHNHPEPHRQQASEDLFDWKDNEDAGNGDKFGEMQSFDTKPSAAKPKSELNLPEKDRPRAPAAFAAFANGGHIAASNLPRGDDTLINWEDDEPEDEGAPKKDPVQDVFGDVQFGSFETQEQKSNEPDLFDLSNAQPKGTKSSSNQDIFDPFEGGFHNSSEQFAQDDNDFLGNQDDDGQTFDPFTGGEDVFDPFAGQQQQSQAKSSRKTITSQDTADPLPKSLPSSANTSQNGTFDPFGELTSQGTDSTKPKPPSGDGFDPFAGMTNSVKTTAKPPSNDTFDPFAGNSKPEPVKSTPKPPSNDTFDPFAGNSKPEPVKTAVKPPSNDTFDPFAGNSKATTSNNDFDPFTKPSNDAFDPFSSSIPSKQPQSSKDIMDMLSAPSPKVNDDTFDPFSGNSKPEPVKSQQQKSTPKPPSGDGFDPFAGMTNSAKTTAKPPSNDTFDPFAGNSKPAPVKSTPKPPSNDTFDPFAGNSKPAPAKTAVKPPSNDTFDPFAGNSKATTSSNAFDPFPASNNKSRPTTNDTFDPFAGSSKPEPAKPKPAASNNAFDAFSSPQQKSPSKPTTNDTFDPFAGATETTKKPAPKQASTNAFDMFGSASPSPAASNKASQNTFELFGSSSSSSQQKPKPSNDVFDPFAGVQQQKPQQQPKQAPKPQSSANAFDMFGSSTQQKPKPSNDTFDPFSGIQQQKPQQQQQSLKSKFAAQPQQQQKPQQKLLGANPSQQNQGSKGSDVFDMLGF